MLGVINLYILVKSVNTPSKALISPCEVHRDAMGSITVGAKLEDDSDLGQRFETYKEEQMMETNSEALRNLIRAGLEVEMDDTDGDVTPQPEQKSPSVQSGNLVSGNESILIAIAFILGGQSFFEVMSVIVGSGLASAGFVAVGVLIIAGMLVQNHDRLLKPFAGSQ
jgi:hypothetical protein